jgi:Tol biopolymer transport system component
MDRARRSWQFFLLVALASVLAALSTGCEQTDEDCWQPSGDVLPVTSDTTGTDNARPKISPDGTRVAFSTDFWGTENFDDEPRRDIAVIDLPAPGELRTPVRRLFDVGNARRIVYPRLPDDRGASVTDFAGTVSAWPAWHPDGVRMAAVVNIKADGRSNFDRLYFFEPNFAGPAAQQIEALNPVLVDDVGLSSDLSNNQYQYSTPAFSPDGQWLAYSRFFFRPADLTNQIPAVTVNPAIFAYNLIDGRVIRVTRGSSIEWEPAWSPSGTEIAFTANRGTSTGHPEIFKIAFDPANPAVDGQPDGAVRLTFTDVDPRPKIPVGALQPTWMASGRIVYTSTQRPPCTSLRDRNVWTMDAAGGDQLIVFQSRTDDQYPSADPTGSNTIVFTTRLNQAPDFVGQKSDIWVLRNFAP